MLKKSVIAIAALAAAAVALPAAAQMSMSSAYVGAGFGQSKFKDACTGTISGVSCDDKDTAWRLLGGYQFNRNFSAELAYTNLGEAKASGGGAEAKVKASVWELDGVGLFPVANQFGIYGKLGLHHGEAKLESNIPGVDGKDTGNGWTWGAGLQWDVMPQLGLRGEFQRYQKVGGESDNKLDLLMLNAIWRFR